MQPKPLDTNLFLPWGHDTTMVHDGGIWASSGSSPDPVSLGYARSVDSRKRHNYRTSMDVVPDFLGASIQRDARPGIFLTTTSGHGYITSWTAVGMASFVEHHHLRSSLRPSWHTPCELRRRQWCLVGCRRWIRPLAKHSGEEICRFAPIDRTQHKWPWVHKQRQRQEERTDWIPEMAYST
jgi:hypothetical protein